MPVCYFSTLVVVLFNSILIYRIQLSNSNFGHFIKWLCKHAARQIFYIINWILLNNTIQYTITFVTWGIWQHSLIEKGLSNIWNFSLISYKGHQVYWMSTSGAWVIRWVEGWLRKFIRWWAVRLTGVGWVWLHWTSWKDKSQIAV